MNRAIKVQMCGIRMAFASRMAYRADFFISSFISLIGDLVLPLATFLIYSSGAVFPGWNLYEVLLIQGIFLVTRGIASSLFFGVVGQTLSNVREGTFDLLLLKPHSPLHLSMALSFSCDDIGVILGGTALSVVALTNAATVGPLNIAGFLLLLLFSQLMLISCAVLMASTVFKWVGNSRIYEIFDSITIFGQYPATIFSKGFINIITWVLPVSVIAFMPASVLLGKHIEGLFTALPAVLVLLSLSLILWRTMIKKYQSVGG